MATFNEQANSILSQVLPILAADRTRRKDLEVRKEASDYNNALEMNRLFMRAGVTNKKDYIKEQKTKANLNKMLDMARMDSYKSAQVDIDQVYKHLQTSGAWGALEARPEYQEWMDDPEKFDFQPSNETAQGRYDSFVDSLSPFIMEYSGFSIKESEARAMANYLIRNRATQDYANIEKTITGTDKNRDLQSISELESYWPD
jgi:hypothetical protein